MITERDIDTARIRKEIAKLAIARDTCRHPNLRDSIEGIIEEKVALFHAYANGRP